MFGLKAKERNLNLTNIAASANSCDEQVPTTNNEETFTVDVSDNFYTRSGMDPIKASSLNS